MDKLFALTKLTWASKWMELLDSTQGKPKSEKCGKFHLDQPIRLRNETKIKEVSFPHPLHFGSTEKEFTRFIV